MKVSIVAEGGGMRGAYVFGVMDALWEHYGLRRVDVAAGTSASAGTLAYFVAGHGHRDGHSVWADEVSSPHFISMRNLLRGRPIMDVDYLIDVIFKQRFPLDISAIQTSPIQFIIPIESASTGAIEYIDVRNSSYDTFELLRATCAAPIVYNKTVALGSDQYCDPYFNEAFPLRSPQVNGTKKIIILSKPRTYVASRDGNFGIHLCRPIISKTVYRTMQDSGEHRESLMQECATLEKEGDVIIAPRELYGTALDNRKETIESHIRRGYEDALANAEIKKLMTTLRSGERSSFYFSRP